jgi:hypothetical protein
MAMSAMSPALLNSSGPAIHRHHLLHHLSAVEAVASSFLVHHFPHHLGTVHTFATVEKFFLRVFWFTIHCGFSFELNQRAHSPSAED